MIELFIAFGAGLISFLSPCVLPLIPGYISYISGSSLNELLEKKNVNLIPISGLSWDLKWIKVKAIEKLVLKYSKKKTRDIKKLNFYIPKALNAISELERFKSFNISKTNEANDYYEKLVKAISYSIKYAQVKGIKGLDEFEIGFNPTTVKEIRNNIIKISKKKDFSSKDIQNILSSYDALNEPGDNKFIKDYWPKLIKKRSALSLEMTMKIITDFSPNHSKKTRLKKEKMDMGP